MSFDQLITASPYSLKASEKEAILLSTLNSLTEHHYSNCVEYRRLIDAVWYGRRCFQSLEELPYLPVGLFKEMHLSSTQEPTMVLRSSGTTGQVPSIIQLDATTADRQGRAMVETLRPILGEKRLPLLVIDARETISERDSLTARGAGVLGMMKFGSAPLFSLDSQLRPDVKAIKAFVSKHGRNKFFIFGFTFLVWTALYKAFEDGELDLANAVLIHSGGWKRMEADSVSNQSFRASLQKRFNLTKVFNFYGFVEQIGSLFVEGEEGILYAPNFADVIIRDEKTWKPLPHGEDGIIQVVSVLPTSYPGHSVLTEDIGCICAVDSGIEGRYGKAIRVRGRVKKVELRGCSDVIAAQA